MIQDDGEATTLSRPVLVGRGLVGGLLMGLANLVPGISGGTMLLATGIYPQFISAVAELSTLRFRARSLLLLGVVAVAAAAAIVGLAGVAKELVVHQRWVMYSLFIGLTLGGVPVVWRLLGRLSTTVVVGALVGLAAMLLLAFTDPGSTAAEAGSQRAFLLLVLAGVAGGSAMILPGVSGGYLLLVLGQYVAILGAISGLRQGLSSGGGAALKDPATILVAVAIGAALGLVGVSNLMKLLLRRHPRATLGFLMGLLLGAVFGLYPFQEPLRPELGDVVKGQRLLSEEQISALEPEDWPTSRFSPSGGQMAASLGLILVGFAVSFGVSKIGSDKAD